MPKAIGPADVESAAATARESAADPLWQSAARSLPAADADIDPATVLAPAGFAAYMPGVREYAASADLRGLLEGRTQWLVVHKDQVASLALASLVASIIEARLTFANEVFCIFNLPSPERRADPHVSSFLARLHDRIASATGVAGTPREGPVYLGDHTALTRTIYGHKLFVDTRDVSLAPHLLIDGNWEPEVTQVLRKLIRPGMVVVEVGTNCGFYSTLIADGIGPMGRYYGFDANPRMCDLARRSLEINGLRERAEVFNQAVSDQAGKLPFQIFANHMGGSTLLDVDKEFAEHLNDRVTTVEVESVRLDAALAALAAIDFLKIDAEGAEPRVLTGAEQLIGRSPMLIMILEFNPAMFSSLATARAYLGRLRKLGFRLRRITAEANCEEISEQVLLTRAHSELFLDRE